MQFQHDLRAAVPVRMMILCHHFSSISGLAKNWESVSAGLKQAIAPHQLLRPDQEIEIAPIPRSRIAKQSLRERNPFPRHQVDSQFGKHPVDPCLSRLLKYLGGHVKSLNSFKTLNNPALTKPRSSLLLIRSQATGKDPWPIR